MLLFFIRHGDPNYSLNRLTPLGVRQADALAKRLARYGIDRIYSSGALRVLETARPTCDLLHKEPIVLDWLNERYSKDFAFGETETTRYWYFAHPETKAQLASSEVMRLGKEWYKHPYFAETNLEFGIQRVQQETDAFLASLGYEHDSLNNRYIVTHPNEERIAVFAHRGLGMAFLSCLLDIPYPLFSTHFDFTHTGMTVIEFSNEHPTAIPRVLQFGGDSHIYNEDLPSGFCNEIKY